MTKITTALAVAATLAALSGTGFPAAAPAASATASTEIAMVWGIGCKARNLVETPVVYDCAMIL